MVDEPGQAHRTHIHAQRRPGCPLRHAQVQAVGDGRAGGELGVEIEDVVPSQISEHGAETGRPEIVDVEIQTVGLAAAEVVQAKIQHVADGGQRSGQGDRHCQRQQARQLRRRRVAIDDGGERRIREDIRHRRRPDHIRVFDVVVGQAGPEVRQGRGVQVDTVRICRGFLGLQVLVSAEQIDGVDLGRAARRIIGEGDRLGRAQIVRTDGGADLTHARCPEGCAVRGAEGDTVHRLPPGTHLRIGCRSEVAVVVQPARQRH